MLSTPSHEPSPGTTVFDLAGRLDGESSDQLYEIVTETSPPRPTNLVLNLEKITFVSSAGLRAILKVSRWA